MDMPWLRFDQQYCYEDLMQVRADSEGKVNLAAPSQDAAVRAVFRSVFNQTPSTNRDIAAKASGSSALILLAI